jgi:shikimate kinase
MDKYGRIYLIGPMGAGKTSVGMELSLLLDCNFLDADILLEQKSRLSITNMFQEYGEAYFRDQEALLLENISKHQNVIIATGGGSILHTKNRELLKSSGIVCYLQVDLLDQIQRLNRSINRPLLPNDLYNRAVYLLQSRTERQNLYKQTADIAIDTTGDNVKSVAQKLRQLIIEETICT